MRMMHHAPSACSQTQHHANQQLNKTTTYTHEIKGIICSLSGFVTSFPVK